LLQDVLAKCQPRHADHLITSWLSADLLERRALAARALGQMRLQRSLPYLVGRAKSMSEIDQVVHEAAFAIANIGGPDAVTALEDLLTAMREDEQRSGDLRWALTHCLADAVDDAQFARLARDILAIPPSEVCFVYRAVGLRRDDRFTSELHHGLESTDPAVRGQSALALARIGDGKAHDVLARAVAEAANSQERILASLGLLSIGEAVPSDPELRQLRKDLSLESFLYKRLITDDIVQVLSTSEHPQATSIAEAWRGIYAAGQDY
jgi:HEAT repeat protein